MLSTALPTVIGWGVGVTAELPYPKQGCCKPMTSVRNSGMLCGGGWFGIWKNIIHDKWSLKMNEFTIWIPKSYHNWTPKHTCVFGVFGDEVQTFLGWNWSKCPLKTHIHMSQVFELPIILNLLRSVSSGHSKQPLIQTHGIIVNDKVWISLM